MLYVTTRGDKDAFTAARTLTSDVAADGGLYVPFRLPEFTKEELEAIAAQSFGQTVAQILNVFFSARLTGWDVDFAVGRNPVKLASMNHRIVFAELWHNPDSDYFYMVNKLYQLLCQSLASTESPTEWVRMAVRISVLFGIFGELKRRNPAGGDRIVDLAVAAEDLSLPMASWYARKMGLPIGTIVCGCDMNSALWDLVRRGEYSTNAISPEADIGVERLIQASLGFAETRKFRQCSASSRAYQVDEEQLPDFANGLFVAVVGKTRKNAITASVYNTSRCMLTEDAALAYGALQDYRASVTEGRPCLLLGDTPARRADQRI